jgi:hypothetical protein
MMLPKGPLASRECTSNEIRYSLEDGAAAGLQARLIPDKELLHQ